MNIWWCPSALLMPQLCFMLNKFVFVYLDWFWSPTLILRTTSNTCVVFCRGSWTISSHQAKKCEFHMSSVPFLDFIISKNHIQMDPSKVSAITLWPALLLCLPFCVLACFGLKDWIAILSGLLVSPPLCQTLHGWIQVQGKESNIGAQMHFLSYDFIRIIRHYFIWLYFTFSFFNFFWVMGKVKAQGPLECLTNLTTRHW